MSGSFQGCCGDFRILDGWVLAFGRRGSWRWKSPFEAPGLGAFSDEAESVAVGADGGIYVGGWAALGPEADDVAADHELFLQRLDRHGAVHVVAVYPATAHLDQHFGADLAVRGHALMVSALVDGSGSTFGTAARSRLARAVHARAAILVWSRQWGIFVGPSGAALGGDAWTARGTRSSSGPGVIRRTMGLMRSFGGTRPRVSSRGTCPLQQGQRLMEGGDVAWRRGSRVRHGRGGEDARLRSAVLGLPLDCRPRPWRTRLTHHAAPRLTA